MSNKLHILFLATLMIVSVAVSAGARNVGSDQARSLSRLSKANSDLVGAASQYKTSVQALIPIYEENLKSAAEALAKRKELLARGLVSKRDIDAGEQAVKDAQTQLDETRQQLTESDQLIAEANVQGSGFRVQGSGFKSQISNLRFSDSEFLVRCSGASVTH